MLILNFFFIVYIVSLNYSFFKDTDIIIRDWLILKFVSALSTGTVTSVQINSASLRYLFLSPMRSSDGDKFILP